MFGEVMYRRWASLADLCRSYNHFSCCEFRQLVCFFSPLLLLLLLFFYFFINFFFIFIYLFFYFFIFTYFLGGGYETCFPMIYYLKCSPRVFRFIIFVCLVDLTLISPLSSCMLDKHIP